MRRSKACFGRLCRHSRFSIPWITSIIGGSSPVEPIEHTIGVSWLGSRSCVWISGGRKSCHDPIIVVHFRNAFATIIYFWLICAGIVPHTAIVNSETISWPNTSWLSSRTCPSIHSWSFCWILGLVEARLHVGVQARSWTWLSRCWGALKSILARIWIGPWRSVPRRSYISPQRRNSRVWSSWIPQVRRFVIWWQIAVLNTWWSILGVVSISGSLSSRSHIIWHGTIVCKRIGAKPVYSICGRVWIISRIYAWISRILRWISRSSKVHAAISPRSIASPAPLNLLNLFYRLFQFVLQLCHACSHFGFLHLRLLLLFLGFFQLSQLFSQHVSGLILLTLQLIV